MGRTNYFVEQCCTVGVAGAYAGVTMAMYVAVRTAEPGERTLLSIVVPWIQHVVLAGGIVLFVLVLLRAIGILRAAGQGNANGHHHDHGHEGHDHGHDHGWSPWRYAVLLFPLLLFFLPFPYDELIAEYERSLIGGSETFKGQVTSAGAGDELGGLGILAISQHPIERALAVAACNFGAPDTYPLSLQPIVTAIEEEADVAPDITADVDQLEKVGATEAQRKQWEGYRRIEVQGMYSPMTRPDGRMDPRLFQIVRLSMACCLTDAQPYKLMAMSRKPLPPMDAQQWVTVQGRIHFQEVQGQMKPILRAFRVKPTKAPVNPYLN